MANLQILEDTSDIYSYMYGGGLGFGDFGSSYGENSLYLFATTPDSVQHGGFIFKQFDDIRPSLSNINTLNYRKQVVSATLHQYHKAGTTRSSRMYTDIGYVFQDSLNTVNSIVMLRFEQPENTNSVNVYFYQGRNTDNSSSSGFIEGSSFTSWEEMYLYTYTDSVNYDRKFRVEFDITYWKTSAGTYKYYTTMSLKDFVTSTIYQRRMRNQTVTAAQVALSHLLTRNLCASYPYYHDVHAAFTEVVC